MTTFPAPAGTDAPAAVASAPDDKVLGQPIGYWTGEAHRLIGESLREALASNGLSQPQWWILNALVSAGAGLSRTALVDQLAPFNANEQNLDLHAEIDDLCHRDLVREDADGLVVTTTGVETRARSVTLNAATHRAMVRGVSDEQYIAVINALRQVIGNLGGSSEIF